MLIRPVDRFDRGVGLAGGVDGGFGVDVDWYAGVVYVYGGTMYAVLNGSFSGRSSSLSTKPVDSTSLKPPSSPSVFETSPTLCRRRSGAQGPRRGVCSPGVVLLGVLDQEVLDVGEKSIGLARTLDS